MRVYVIVVVEDIVMVEPKLYLYTHIVIDIEHQEIEHGFTPLSSCREHTQNWQRQLIHTRMHSPHRSRDKHQNISYDIEIHIRTPQSRHTVMSGYAGVMCGWCVCVWVCVVVCVCVRVSPSFRWEHEPTRLTDCTSAASKHLISALGTTQ